MTTIRDRFCIDLPPPPPVKDVTLQDRGCRPATYGSTRLYATGRLRDTAPDLVRVLASYFEGNRHYEHFHAMVYARDVHFDVDAKGQLIATVTAARSSSASKTYPVDLNRWVQKAHVLDMSRLFRDSVPTEAQVREAMRKLSEAMKKDYGEPGR